MFRKSFLCGYILISKRVGRNQARGLKIDEKLETYNIIACDRGMYTNTPK